MNATWKNTDKRSETGWNVIHVYERVCGGYGTLLDLGFDNTRPDESLFQTERRIAQRFNCKRIDLVLEIV